MLPWYRASDSIFSIEVVAGEVIFELNDLLHSLVEQAVTFLIVEVEVASN
jgi:hypothetical protein